MTECVRPSTAQEKLVEESRELDSKNILALAISVAREESLGLVSALAESLPVATSSLATLMNLSRCASRRRPTM